MNFFSTEKERLETLKGKVEAELTILEDEENTLREDLSILIQQIQNDEVSAQIDKTNKRN